MSSAATRSSAPPTATAGTHRWLGPPQGRLVTMEGVWGAGKSTAAQQVSTRLRAAGFTTTVIHYGGEPGTIGRLSQFLEAAPLRARTGLGGYHRVHHSAVDVLLRLCREAHHHLNSFQPALAGNDVVIVDHGVYSKIAWALTVLTETDPHQDPGRLLTQLQGITAPWFCTPDLPIYLDTPWPLARERAIGRGHGGGNPAAIERLLFLPRYVQSYRYVLAEQVTHAVRVPVGLRPADAVADEITTAILADLRAGPPADATPSRERFPLTDRRN